MNTQIIYQGYLKMTTSNKIHKPKNCGRNKKSKQEKVFDKNFGALIGSKRYLLEKSRSKLLENTTLELIDLDYFGEIERGEKSVSLYKALNLIQLINIQLDEHTIDEKNCLITLEDLLTLLDK